jgi:hypothetical protein
LSFRVVHLIQGECDIFVSTDNKKHVRIRISERDTDNPTDIEIEGNPVFIAEAMETVAGVLNNLESITNYGEPN